VTKHRNLAKSAALLELGVSPSTQALALPLGHFDGPIKILSAFAAGITERTIL
jgi:hypothetical protein